MTKVFGCFSEFWIWRAPGVGSAGSGDCYGYTQAKYDHGCEMLGADEEMKNMCKMYRDRDRWFVYIYS